MKRIEALEKASQIAGIVKKNAHFLHEWSFDGCGSDKKMKVFEIVLFGSATRKCDDETVGDIDILVIDNGIYSSECSHASEEDEYHLLGDNFSDFVSNVGAGRLMVQYGREILSDLAYETKVDMHVLPLRFFRNKKFRKEVKSRHHDPDFFKNVFSTAMRWRMGKQFVPVDVSYFERKYKVRLHDLKK